MAEPAAGLTAGFSFLPDATEADLTATVAVPEAGDASSAKAGFSDRRKLSGRALSTSVSRDVSPSGAFPAAGTASGGV